MKAKLIEKKKRRVKKQKWELYIIQTKSKKLYTGITTDLDRRFMDHQSGKKGARFFRFSEPEKILFREIHPNRSKATKREIKIKKMSRKDKLAFIDSIAPKKKFKT